MRGAVDRPEGLRLADRLRYVAAKKLLRGSRYRLENQKDGRGRGGRGEGTVEGRPPTRLFGQR